MRLPTQTVIQMYQDNLFRIAFSICQNREDAEDVVQETFLRYHSGAVNFNDEMHIRAWLIRVTINQSKICFAPSGTGTGYHWKIIWNN